MLMTHARKYENKRQTKLYGWLLVGFRISLSKTKIGEKLTSSTESLFFDQTTAVQTMKDISLPKEIKTLCPNSKRSNSTPPFRMDDVTRRLSRAGPVDKSRKKGNVHKFEY